MPLATYTHTGGRAYVGRRYMTPDAHRKEGRTHALNMKSFGIFVALCGVVVEIYGTGAEDMMVGENPVEPASDGPKVDCAKCLKAIEAGAKA